MIPWRYSWYDARRYFKRCFLLISGIALCTAFTLTIQLSQQLIHRGYESYLNLGQSNLHFRIQHQNLEPFANHSLDHFKELINKNIPDYSFSFHDYIQRSIALNDGKSSYPLQLLGIEEAIANDWGIMDDRFSLKKGLWLDSKFATTHHLHEGSSIFIWSDAGFYPLTVSGLYTSAKRLQQSTMLFPPALIPLNQLQGLFHLNNRIDFLQIDFSSHEGTISLSDKQKERCAKSVAELLPDNYIIDTGSSQNSISESFLKMIDLGFFSLGVIALIAIFFLITQIFWLNWQQRKKDFAILQLIGFTRGQIRNTLLREAIILGLCGSLLGIILTILCFPVSIQLFEELFQCSFTSRIPFDRSTYLLFLVAVISGPLLGWSASYRFTRKIAHFEILPTMVESDSSTFDHVPLKKSLSYSFLKTPLVLFIIFTAADVIIEMGIYLSYIPKNSNTMLIKSMIYLLQSMLFLPTILPRIWKGIARIGSMIFPSRFYLIYQQFSNDSNQFISSSRIIFLSSLLLVTFAHWLFNSLADVKTWHHHAIVADYLVRSAKPDSTLLMSSALPESLQDRLSLIPGVEKIEKITFMPMSIDHTGILVLARTFLDKENIPLDLRNGQPQEVRQKLLEGEIAIASPLAKHLNKTIGDYIELNSNALTRKKLEKSPVQSSKRQFRIAAIVNEYAGGGNSIYMNWEQSKKYLSIPGVHAFLIQVIKPSESPTYSQRNENQFQQSKLEDFCNKNYLTLETCTELRSQIEHLTDQIEMIFWWLGIIQFLFTGFILFNTYAAQLPSQQNNWTALHLCGMRKSGIRSMIWGQTAIVALSTSVIGSITGALIAKYLQTWVDQQFGYQLKYQVYPSIILIGVLLGLLTPLISILILFRNRFDNMLRTR